MLAAAHKAVASVAVEEPPVAVAPVAVAEPPSPAIELAREAVAEEPVPVAQDDRVDGQQVLVDEAVGAE